MATTGKTYRMDGDRSYPFVASTEEHDRLEEQSAGINEVMFDKPFRAPIESPSKIIDIGCGTGLQTDLLAKRYPNATIVGIDRSPVPDLRPKPDNVTYVLGDFHELLSSKHKLLQPGTFDLVYGRMLLLAVSSWPQHLENMKAMLKPGGYIECQEIDFHEIYDKTDRLLSANWKWPEVWARWPKEQGLDITMAKQLPSLLQGAGFGAVENLHFPMPFREGWKEHPESEKISKYLNWASRIFWKVSIENGAREGDDVEALMEEVESEIFEGEIGRHGILVVATGRKE